MRSPKLLNIRSPQLLNIRSLNGAGLRRSPPACSEVPATGEKKPCGDPLPPRGTRRDFFFQKSGAPAVECGWPWHDAVADAFMRELPDSARFSTAERASSPPFFLRKSRDSSGEPTDGPAAASGGWGDGRSQRKPPRSSPSPDPVPQSCSTCGPPPPKKMLNIRSASCLTYGPLAEHVQRFSVRYLRHLDEQSRRGVLGWSLLYGPSVATSVYGLAGHSWAWPWCGRQCVYGLAGHQSTWPGGSVVYLAWRATKAHGLAGQYCTWPGGSPVYMAWRVTDV